MENPLLPESNKNTTCKTPRWQLLKAQINNLEPRKFLQKIQSDDKIILVDVRTPSEFMTCSLPNAINIDYLGEGFWDKIEQLPLDATLLVYCRTGRRSLRTCTLMKNGGFDVNHVFNLDGGLTAWEEEFGITFTTDSIDSATVKSTQQID